MTIKRRLSGIFHGEDLKPLPGWPTVGYVFKVDTSDGIVVIIVFEDGRMQWDDVEPEKFFKISKPTTKQERELLYQKLKTNFYEDLKLSETIKQFSYF